MNVLVTGGAGFIGSHLCKRLIENGNTVVVIDNLSNGSEKNLKGIIDNPQLILCKFDINNKQELSGVFGKYSFDMVFHLAANADVYKGADNYHLDYANTLQSTLSVLEIMHQYGVKRLFFASSSTIYGNPIDRINEHSPSLRPISHYGAAKLASEAFISSFNSLYGIEVMTARFCNTVGPNMTHGVIPDLIRKLKSHPTELIVYGDGKQTKPYIYIDDLLDGISRIIENSDQPYNDYLVGVDSSLTVTRIAQIVMNEMGTQIPIKYRNLNTCLNGDQCYYQYDVTKLRMLGWTPKYTAEEAIRKAVIDNLS